MIGHAGAILLATCTIRTSWASCGRERQERKEGKNKEGEEEEGKKEEGEEKERKEEKGGSENGTMMPVI